MIQCGMIKTQRSSFLDQTIKSLTDQKSIINRYMYLIVLDKREYQENIFRGADPGGFLRGFDIIEFILPYLLYVFGQTDLNK